MAPAHLAELQALSPKADLMVEGGKEFVFLPSLTLPNGLVRDALLCPSEHSGYTTRLFLSEKVEGRGQNWNPFNIFGRTWWSPSFNQVQAAMRPIQILDAHLQVYR